MICLSSIVKAKSLCNTPKISDHTMIKNENHSHEKGHSHSQGQNHIENNESLLREAMKKSQDIESEATNRANSLLESAINNSQTILAVAEKKGYDEGYIRGLVDGAKASEEAAQEGLSELNRLVKLMKAEQREEIGRAHV